jgi:sugar O-acyltransferase (sialic acid O-acetyltransferase NeuD family)
MRKIIVCGAGGAGRETIDMLESMNGDSRWDIVGFSDAAALEGQTVRGYPVMREDDLLNYDEPIDAVISVGSPTAREKIFLKLSKNPNVSFPAVVHPTSYIAGDVDLPEGVLIGKSCSVSPDVVIGRGVFLNGFCAVGHDVTIGNFSVFMAFSLMAGNVTIGQRVSVGAGSVVVQSLTVGDDAELCAGSVVLRNVKSSAKMLGNPARPIDLKVVKLPEQL